MGWEALGGPKAGEWHDAIKKEDSDCCVENTLQGAGVEAGRPVMVAGVLAVS